MRLTARKKEILSYYAPDNLAWVTSEIGPPPFDVCGIAYLLHGTDSFERLHLLESTRRTLEAMVRDGLLERVNVYERRQNKTQGGDGDGVRCVVARYGLPGQCRLIRDNGDGREAIEGECVRL
ncbi:hypothetical protein [Escherichia coli]|uniref:hypothetical protein n=1 Tax=Escherichia coli TaxID=562 RepID=UPI00135D5EED|nr:hypothetical protein [Escherichia coli]MXF07408.1 hypothetical protein [Escherichia coli]